MSLCLTCQSNIYSIGSSYRVILFSQEKYLNKLCDSHVKRYILIVGLLSSSTEESVSITNCCGVGDTLHYKIVIVYYLSLWEKHIKHSDWWSSSSYLTNVEGESTALLVSRGQELPKQLIPGLCYGNLIL